MKVKVIKKFRDKHTKEVHKRDTELDITEERLKEIQKKGNFVEVIQNSEDGEGTEDTQNFEDGEDTEDTQNFEDGEDVDTSEAASGKSTAKRGRKAAN